MDTTFYHVCTSEDHQDIFLLDSDYETAINILALCLALFEDLSIYSFAFMSNHIHLLMSGSLERIREFWKFYVKTLSRYYRAEGRSETFSDLTINLHPIRDNDYMQNVVAYIHRNPSVADRNISPCNYRWSTGRYFFNSEAQIRYSKCKKKVTLKQRQLYSRSRKFDDVASFFETDNYISPMCFCKIAEGEKCFSSANQYLYLLTKNIESTKEIASLIGERITYADYELYPVIKKMSSNLFLIDDLSSLTPNQKVRIAKSLHYDYNSSNKQISRLLKLEISVVNDLYPLSKVSR